MKTEKLVLLLAIGLCCSGCNARFQVPLTSSGGQVIDTSPYLGLWRVVRYGPDESKVSPELLDKWPPTVPGTTQQGVLVPQQYITVSQRTDGSLSVIHESESANARSSELDMYIAMVGSNTVASLSSAMERTRGSDRRWDIARIDLGQSQDTMLLRLADTSKVISDVSVGALSGTLGDKSDISFFAGPTADVTADDAELYQYFVNHPDVLDGLLTVELARVSEHSLALENEPSTASSRTAVSLLNLKNIWLWLNIVVVVGLGLGAFRIIRNKRMG